MKNIKYCIIIILIFAAFNLKAQNKEIVFLKNDKLTYKILQSENGTYGYDIFKNNKKLIHQPNIPGLEGNNGFTKKKYAKLTAQLVIKKIKKNIMPPTVTEKELEILGVLKMKNKSMR